MSELQAYTPPGGPDPAGKLIRWAEAASAAHNLALALCATSFVPEEFQLTGRPDDAKRVGNATAAILLGTERGLDPLASLASVYLVRGKPGMYTLAKVALVKSHGHTIWTEDSSPESVTVAGHRKGEPEHVERVTWTIGMAERAGLLRKRGSEPSQYELRPQAMLYARAAGDVAARVAPDVLLGVPEGAEDEPARDMGAQGAAPPQKVRRSTPVTRAPAVTAEPSPAEPESAPAPQEAQQPELTLEDPPALPLEEWEQRVVEERTRPRPTEDVELPVPRGMREGQRAALMAEFNAHGMGRDARLEWISGYLGRDVPSANDLTELEAERVIDGIRAERT